MSQKKLYKSTDNRYLAGVLGGVGEYLSIDPTILRIIYIVLAVWSWGIPLLVIYLLVALIMPTAPETYERRDVTNSNDPQ